MGTSYARHIAGLTLLACVLAGLCALGLARVGTAQAAGTVGSGTPATCTGAALDSAMTAGSGLITFACGPNPVVITITHNGGFNVPNGFFYTIDGGNLVTLTGAGANRLFDVRVGGALTLLNIILTDGYQDGIYGNLPDAGGAILDEGVSLTLEHVTIRNSQSTKYGGGIEIITGTVSVQDSLIEGNQSGLGGGIDNAGSLILNSVAIIGNTAAAGGYWLFNLHAGLQQELRHWHLNESFRIDNLANRAYIGSVIVNETNARFFEPEPGRSAYLMVSAAYH